MLDDKLANVAYAFLKMVMVGFQNPFLRKVLIPKLLPNIRKRDDYRHLQKQGFAIMGSPPQYFIHK